MLWRSAPKPIEVHTSNLVRKFCELCRTRDLVKEFSIEIDQQAQQGYPFTIAVGGVTFGGAGKTPIVQYLTELMIHLGLRVYILGHGYKGALKTSRSRVISASHQSSLQVYGDEALMLAKAFSQEVPVVIGGTWHEKWCLAREGKAEVVISDGGLYTDNLPRHIGVTVVSSVDRFWLCPFGHLTRPMRYWANDPQNMLWEVRNGTSTRSIDFQVDLRSEMIPKYLKNLKTGELLRTFDTNLPSEVSAICGIASPTRFSQMLNKLGFTLNQWITVGDHNLISRKQIEKIKLQSDEMWITTEKDAVKFSEPPINLWQLTVGLNFSRSPKDR